MPRYKESAIVLSQVYKKHFVENGYFTEGPSSLKYCSSALLSPHLEFGTRISYGGKRSPFETVIIKKEKVDVKNSIYIESCKMPIRIITDR
jgi:hypothetical protein